MRKKIGVFSLCVIILLVATVFVTAAGTGIAEAIENSEISQEVQNYVGEFVEKRGIDAEDINEITPIDFDELPKEVNIKNVGNTNLAIYEVDYDEPEGEEQKVFVITYSVDELKAQGDLIIAHDKRQFLNFGFAGELSESTFLETATGVEGSLEQGYVMMREGSITGISTSLEVFEPGEEIKIIIYKNGEPIRFGNTLSGEVGVIEDYDVQSNGVVTFEQGDVISIYASADEEIVFGDVITLIEITTH